MSCSVAPAEVNRRLLEDGIIGGLDLGPAYPDLSRSLLFCVTEMNTRDEIDRLVAVLAAIGAESNSGRAEVAR